MKIMIMGRYERRDELAVYGRELEEMGHVVTSRWLDPELSVSAQVPEGEALYDQKGFSDIFADLSQPMAEVDMQDTLRADVALLFSEHPQTAVVRGARHVEFGMAMGFNAALSLVCRLTSIPEAALGMGGIFRKRLIVVGPRENVYHCLSGAVEVFPDWEAAKDALGNANSASLVTVPTNTGLVGPNGAPLS